MTISKKCFVNNRSLFIRRSFTGGVNRAELSIGDLDGNKKVSLFEDLVMVGNEQEDIVFENISDTFAAIAYDNRSVIKDFTGLNLTEVMDALGCKETFAIALGFKSYFDEVRNIGVKIADEKFTVKLPVFVNEQGELTTQKYSYTKAADGRYVKEELPRLCGRDEELNVFALLNRFETIYWWFKNLDKACYFACAGLNKDEIAVLGEMLGFDPTDYENYTKKDGAFIAEQIAEIRLMSNGLVFKDYSAEEIDNIIKEM